MFDSQIKKKQWKRSIFIVDTQYETINDKLNRHDHFDRLVGIVSEHLKVRNVKVINVHLVRIDFKLWKRTWFTE
jgi:hypothetical protein